LDTLWSLRDQETLDTDSNGLEGANTLPGTWKQKHKSKLEAVSDAFQVPL
jgi:hypothetical protein